MSEKQKNYFKRLDIIRLISCVFVFLYHLNLLKGGYLAVCTFFVMSGYLCVAPALNENFSIKKYYLNRIKKIYLPLLIVTFSTVILFKINPFTTWLNLKPETTSVILGYNNFWQLSANLDYFTRHVNSPFMHFWYIAILIQFDIVFPLIVVILKKVNQKLDRDLSTIIVTIITIAITIIFFIQSKRIELMKVYYSTILRSFSILFGVLLALLTLKVKIKLSNIQKRFNSSLFLIYMILLTILCFLVSDNSNNYAIYMIVVSFISTRLIRYSVIPKRKRERVVYESTSLKFWAKRSYEIYLVQYPVIFFMQNFKMNEFLKVPLIVIITIIIALILHELTTIKKRKRVLNIIKCGIITAIIIAGLVLVIVEKDHTEEMKELENSLNENTKIIEEKNQKFLNNLSQINTEEKLEETEEKVVETNTNKESLEEIEARISAEVKQIPVVGIGDSVMLGAINSLYAVFPNGYFDGKVSRSLHAGIDILKDLKKKGALGDTIILALANNSDFFTWDLNSLLEVTEGKEVYWVDAVLADDPKFNGKFEEFAKDHPNIHVVKWEYISKGHSEYFAADGIHLKNKAAMDVYANSIYEAVYNQRLKDYCEANNISINN